MIKSDANLVAGSYYGVQREITRMERQGDLEGAKQLFGERLSLKLMMNNEVRKLLNELKSLERVTNWYLDVKVCV